jgi:heme exporter protein A
VTDSGQPYLKAHGLTLFRGDRCLFKRLDLEVGPGEALHVVGPNGSGKTTLLRTLAGLTLAEDGQVYWSGQRIEAIRQEYAQDLAWCGHRPALKDDLTLLENLSLHRRLRFGRDDAAVASVMDRLKVGRLAHIQAGRLSAGQRRRASLANLLLSEARLWLMDEPLTNLDVAGKALVKELISEHVTGGGLCVLVAHEAVEVAHVELAQLPLGRPS